MHKATLHAPERGYSTDLVRYVKTVFRLHSGFADRCGPAIDKADWPCSYQGQEYMQHEQGTVAFVLVIHMYRVFQCACCHSISTS